MRSHLLAEITLKSCEPAAARSVGGPCSILGNIDCRRASPRRPCASPPACSHCGTASGPRIGQPNGETQQTQAAEAVKQQADAALAMRKELVEACDEEIRHAQYNVDERTANATPHWADSIGRRNTIFVGHRATPETDLATMLGGPTWTSVAPGSVSSRTSRRCAAVPQAASWTRPARGALPEAGRLQGMVLVISPRNAIWILGLLRQHRSQFRTSRAMADISN